MKFCYFLLLLFQIIFCYSQNALGSGTLGPVYNNKKPHVIEIDKDIEETFYEFPFKITTVIDSTSNNGVYGTIRKGAQQTYRYVKFKNSIESEFHRLINKLSFFNPLGRNITMVIKDFTLLQEKQKITIILSVNYLYQGEIYSYHLQSYHDTKPADNKKYAIRIRELINKSLKELEYTILND